MIGKSLLAATIASGLAVPPEAGIYVPPKPAIVKPENLDFSKNMLAMPMLVGAIKPQSGPPATLSYVVTYRNNFLGTSSRVSASDVSLGATAANRTLIFVFCAIASTNVANAVSSVTLTRTFDTSVNMVKRYELAVGNFALAFFTVRQSNWVRADTVVNLLSGQAGLSWAVYAAYGLTSDVPTDVSSAWGADALPASGLGVQRGGIVIGGAMTNRPDGVVSWSGLTLSESATGAGSMRSSTARLVASQAQSNLAASATFSVAGTLSAAAYAAFR